LYSLFALRHLIAEIAHLENTLRVTDKTGRKFDLKIVCGRNTGARKVPLGTCKGRADRQKIPNEKIVH
jgi:hypothetical protein